MADDTPITDANNALEAIATDELSTLNSADVSAASPRIKVQRFKAGFGSDGDLRDVDATHGLPVTLLSGATVAATDGGGSLTVDGTVAVSGTPAAARTTDSIGAADVTDAVMNNTTAIAPLFAAITASTTGATTIIPLVAAKKIRILAYTIVCTTAVTAQWRSHTTTGQATGVMPFGANGGVSAPYCKLGHFESVAGEALDLVLGGNVAVGGHITYIPV